MGKKGDFMNITMKEQLQQFTSWAGVVGWITIIWGALNAIVGLFLFLLGAAPGNYNNPIRS